MRLFAGVLAAVLMAYSGQALAEDIDLSTWTCKSFVAADKETIGIILTWLDGYYKDQDDPPVIDTEQFVSDAKKLATHCGSHPDQGLITAADTVFTQ
jgi:acid stress chaperone HdeB